MALLNLLRQFGDFCPVAGVGEINELIIYIEIAKFIFIAGLQVIVVVLNDKVGFLWFWRI
jgi:hypothetical protein